MNHLHSKEAVWKKPTVNNPILFEGGESGIRHIANWSDRKKSTDFSSLFRSLRSEKNIPWQHFYKEGFLLPKTPLVITIASQPHKTRGHLRSLRHGMLKGKPMPHVCLARSNESCISWHMCQTETPTPPFGAMAGQICQGGRAWTAEINGFMSFGDVSHLSTQHQTCWP